MAIVKVKLSHAAEEYVDHLEAKGLKPATRRANASALRALLRAVGDVYLHNLTAQHIDRLFSSTNWGAHTRNARRGMYAQFFGWSRNRRYMRPDHDPLFGWRGVRVPERDRLRIPVQEWGKVFEACNTPAKRVVVALGLYLFLRSSEISQIQIQHIDLENQMIQIHRVKTETWDDMPICVELDGYLREYLVWYTQRLADQEVQLTTEHYLVPVTVKGSNQRNPITHQFIPVSGILNPGKPHLRPHLLVQDVLRDAGYSGRMYSEGVHTLRRSGARAYFDSLVDRGYDGALRRVQSMLGHSHTQTTEGYLGIKLDRQQRNAELSGHTMFPEMKAAAATLRAIK